MGPGIWKIWERKYKPSKVTFGYKLWNSACKKNEKKRTPQNTGETHLETIRSKYENQREAHLQRVLDFVVDFKHYNFEKWQ